MAHIRHINDSTGDVIDYAYFCSDSCNSDWHPQGIAADGVGPYRKNGQVEPYGGFYGCMEISFNEECANCGAIVEGINEEVTG